MLLHRLGVKQQVIQITNYAGIKQFKKYRVHHALKRGRRSAKPKGHHKKFKCAIAARERCFLNISVVHRDLMVTISQVKLGEDG